MRKVILTIIISLVFSCIYLGVQNKNLQDKYLVSQANIKSYVSYLDSSTRTNLVLLLTIEQLLYFNDSILLKMVEVKEELSIKDKDIKSLLYMLSKANKVDTIIFRDTLFRDSKLDLDTVLGDKWYLLLMKLKYPSTISISPTFISEKYVLVEYKKETINPPKKCWLLRLFLKKHKVLRVEVIEENPYIDNEDNRFIEIIK